ncbi:MAG TPA: hypothetical protein PLE12_05900 [Propionicimonas sp.]|nr:hypothetical protein [Propionicimonas sp.]
MTSTPTAAAGGHTRCESAPAVAAGACWHERTVELVAGLAFECLDCGDILA